MMSPLLGCRACQHSFSKATWVTLLVLCTALLATCLCVQWENAQPLLLGIRLSSSVLGSPSQTSPGMMAMRPGFQRVNQRRLPYHGAHQVPLSGRFSSSRSPVVTTANSNGNVSLTSWALDYAVPMVLGLGILITAHFKFGRRRLGQWAMMSSTGEKMTVGVLGGGCFGTAFAQLMGRNGYPVKMWVRNAATREHINQNHENPVYLKGYPLSENITATSSFHEAVEGVGLVAVAVPTPFLRDTFIQHRDVLPTKVPIVLLSKGIETHTLMTPTEILREELPGKYNKYICAVSGPSFAHEIAKGLPTNVTCASECKEVAQRVQQMVSDRMFRVYTSDDIIGVEYGGALKNVIAIAAGVSDGMGMGCNGRAALITRGLAEISKLAVAKGGKPITMLSLAGVGDLLMTCTAAQSRNYSVGFRLGKGETLEQIQTSMKEVAEGVTTAKAVHDLAKELGIDAPICEAVYEVLYGGKQLEHAVSDLLDREPGEEIDQLYTH